MIFRIVRVGGDALRTAALDEVACGVVLKRFVAGRRELIGRVVGVLGYLAFALEAAAIAARQIGVLPCTGRPALCRQLARRVVTIVGRCGRGIDCARAVARRIVGVGP